MRFPVSERKLAFLTASIFWIASSAAANALDELAPPGPCAEPREAISGTGLVGDASALAVVGALQSFFSPSDVAAAPEAAPRPAPNAAAAAVRYPGACEAGGSACQAALRSVPGNPIVVPGKRPGAHPRGDYGYPGAAPSVGASPVVPGARPGTP